MVYTSSQDTVKKILNIQEENLADEYPFCICKQEIPGSTMVFCSNMNCPNGVWFHLDCMDMEDEDIPEGDWFCSDNCKKQKRQKKTTSRKKKPVAESIFTDHKKNYTLRVIWRGLNQRIRKDAIRENDGNRIIMHWKFDMLHFYDKHHPKYFLIGQRLLGAINGTVSKRLQHTLKWNRTVNPNGGKGKNIAMDLQMEFFNKEYKGLFND